jgi:hypothetical protein
MGALLDHLVQILDRYDDAAFIALANAGLLRRARKDLAGETPQLETEEATAISYRFAGCSVRLDARGPASASCTCPTTGTCQHVLAVCLHLKATVGTSPEAPVAPVRNDAAATESAAAAAPSQLLHEELVKIDPGTMQRHAGMPGLRWAVQYVADATLETDIAITAGTNIVITFARPRLTFHFMGGGLPAIVTDYTGRDPEKYVVAAVLAYQVAQGMPLPELDTPARVRRQGALNLGKEHEIPATVDENLMAMRVQLLNATRSLLFECLDSGLTHLSDTALQRFTTLAVSAQGAELYRLALILRRIADEVEMLIQRHANASEEVLLKDFAWTYGLIEALQSHGVGEGKPPPTYLLGRPRTSYEDIGKLELIGVAAYPWRTGSGYHGLTVLFWAPIEERWYSFSESRPEIQRGFNPVARYRASGPWSGVSSPAELLGRRFTLIDGRANEAGRLSGADRASVIVLGQAQLDDRLFIDDWNRLAEELARRPTSILQQRAPLDDLVFLQPAHYEKSKFDPVSQLLFWPLVDRQGQVLNATLPYSEFNAHAIERIEALDAAALADIRGVLVRSQRRGASYAFEPLSLATRLDDRSIDALFFDAPKSATPIASGLARFRELLQKKGPVAEADQIAAPASLQKIIEPFSSELVRIAERGLSSHRPASAEWGALRALIQKYERGGLDSVARIARAAAHLARPSREAELVLRLRFALAQLEAMVGRPESET